MFEIETMTVRLPKWLKDKLRNEAKVKGLTQNTLLKQILLDKFQLKDE